MQVDYDVVLTGYGPVGEVLANILGAYGHRVAVFELAPSVYHMPRAAHFDHEAMRIFQSIGLAESIEPATCSIRGMHFLNANGRTLFGFEQPQGPSPQGWNTDYMFYQPALEEALRAGVTRYPNVEVFLEHQVLDVSQTTECVEVEVLDLRATDEPGKEAATSTRVVSASYVIGCDGGRSLTRRCVGITLEDIGFDESWLVIDARLTALVDLPDVCQQICDPARPTTYVPMPEPYRRWEFMLLPGESIEAMEDRERVFALLEPWVRRDQIEIVRAVVYTFHAVLAQGWRQQRVLVAGDAAHQMPPFLGQGMCSGVRDAANVGWKLDRVLRGVSSDAILDTYEPERSPHVRAIIDLAVGFGSMICTLDPDVAAARDARFIGDSGAVTQGGSSLLPPLGPSALLATVAQGRSALAGRLFVQPWVSTDAGDRLLDDVIGDRFALVVGDLDLSAALVSELDSLTVAGEVRVVQVTRAGPTSPHERAGQEARQMNGVGPIVTVEDRDGFLYEWFASHSIGAVILRPDRYVYATAATADDLTAALRALRVALTP